MKIKKIFLMFSMIAVLFSLSACSDGKEQVNFKYEVDEIVKNTAFTSLQFIYMEDAYKAFIENEGDDIYKNALSNFDAATDDCGAFKGFHLKNGNDLFDIDLSQGLTADDQNKLNNIDFVISEENGNVVVVIYGVYDKRDAEIRFVYEEDPSAAYNQQRDPYRLAEVTVTPSYTTGEKMTKAGQNTLMGMGTVFAMLIFIALIISLFKYLDRVVEKVGGFFKRIFCSNKDVENVVTETKQISATTNSPAPVAASTTASTDDAELVAVITAAVVAANVAAGGSDKLVVRSIKKARR